MGEVVKKAHKMGTLSIHIPNFATGFLFTNRLRRDYKCQKLQNNTLLKRSEERWVMMKVNPPNVLKGGPFGNG